MKNMKKILAVGAILTLGTMAMGVDLSDDAIFPINLRVINPISIENTGGEIEFGDLTATQMLATTNVKKGDFKVIGDDTYDFKFTVSETDLKREGETATETIGFTTRLLDSNNTPIADTQSVNTLNGIYNGKLEITLASVTDAVSGNYSGEVNIAVDYN